MATIRKELLITASPEAVWEVVRDVGAVHRRLAPGFVTDTHLEEGARVVTFANGVVARELIVSVEEDARRLVWSVVGRQATHHNSSFQVFPGANGGTRLVWITDVLPDAVAVPLGAMVEAGSKAIQRALGAPAASA
jgi:hypothetical protein